MLRDILKGPGLTLLSLLIFSTPGWAEREILLEFQDGSEQKIRLPRESGEVRGVEIRDLSPPRTFLFSEELSEEFEGRRLSSRWDWLREPRGHWAVREGQFHLTTTGTSFFGDENTAPLLYRRAPKGDFDAVTLVLANPRRRWEQGGIFLYQDDDNYIRVTHIGVGDESQIESIQEIRGQPEGIRVETSSPGEVFLRIRVEGSLVETAHSADGEQWTVVARYFQTYPEPKIAVSAFGRTGAPFAFDFIRLFVP